MVVAEILRGYFSEKLVDDDREPIALFPLPGFEDDLFGLYPPKMEFWNQLVLLILFQLVIQCSVAAVTYLFIVKQRGTFTAFLAGYGLVIPASLCLSYELIELLDIHNKCLRLALTTASTVLVFRTLEAMHGTADAAAVVESSMPAYAAYYSSAVHYLWDPSTGKRRKIRWTELANSLMRVLFYFHTTSLVLSIELYVDFQPFASRVQLDQYNLNSDLLSPAHIANAYALTLLTFLTLATGFELTAFGENLKGFYTQPIFQNPLFTSRSPSQFWGQKWNLLIHRTLKHGVFLPARQYYGVMISILLSFLASGLLHDYCWSVIFYHQRAVRDATTGRCHECFQPKLLKVTAFFLVNAGVLLLERPVGSYLGKMSKQWPTPVVSTILILTFMPVSHWFTGDWALGGYFSDFAIGLWQIRKL